ncbi:MAG: cell wall protein [Microbacterium sp.]
MRKALITAALTLAVAGMGASSAFAAEDDYTPTTSSTLTLAGSTVTTECGSDVPWIAFDVALTDPDDLATSRTAYLTLSDGSSSVDITLGELEDDALSGSVLWPGASVDGTGWPGWTEVDGEWVETSGNYAWTLGDITATIHVGDAAVAVPLSYSSVDSACATPTALSDESPSALATTGGTLSLVALGIGVSALAIGSVLMVRQRRAQH